MKAGLLVFLSVYAVYMAEVGVREKSGKNDGERVEAYLAYAGLKKGNPWCAAFVCWSLGRAGIRNPRSGWSPDLFPRGKVCWQRSRSLQGPGLTGNEGLGLGGAASGTGGKAEPGLGGKVKVPRRGDVFGIYFPEKKRIAHVGFVDVWDEKYVITVEGNTNEAGSREGDGVYRKRRPVSSIYQVARWEEAL